MDIKQIALFWLSCGVASVPVAYRSKKPLVAWGHFKTHLPTEQQINLWYDDNYPKNLALVCGWNGLCVLDFDSVENYAQWFCWQLMHNPKVTETYRVSTNRGVHVYFWLSEGVKLNSIQNALFEVKTGGKLCTTPPSIHESGKPYRSQDNPRNIKTVKAQDILNYSPLAIQPVEIVYPTRSRFAPSGGMPDCVPDIKQKVKILSFFPNARKLDGEGNFWLSDCPFHGHKDNLWIDNRRNLAGCYAGCGVFDVIAFYARLHKISNKEAVLLLSREV